MSSVAQISSVAVSATPWGAVIGGAASVVNNLVDNIFSSGQKKKAQEFKQALATLSNEQQSNLNYAILNAKTDTERMGILTNAVASIRQTQITDSAKSQSKSLVIVLVAVVILVGAVYFLKR